MRELPRIVDAAAHWYTIELAGTSYDLYFDYNGRADRWYLTIKRDGASVVSGVKITNGWNLLRRGLAGTVPDGILCWIDLVGADGPPPGFADLGRRCFGLFVESIPATSTTTAVAGT